MRKGTGGRLAALFEELGFADHGYVINNKKDAIALLDIDEGHGIQKYKKCCGKICYPTKAIASGSMKNRKRKSNVRLRVYFCKMCKYYHLTSSINKTKHRKNERE